MKKILLSLGIIAVVAIVAINATGAFFSDTETSTGNTFTAGAIDLKIDSEQHYNNMVCVLNTETTEEGDYWWQPEAGFVVPTGHYPAVGSPCTGGGSWALKDLVPTSDKFFNFGDIKPGDTGENTISIHVINNDAWVCAEVSNLTSNDNSQTEPESQAPLDTDDMTSGELDDQMIWTIWRDDGDNMQETGEPTLLSGHPVNGVLALYDSTTGNGPLTGATTAHLGVKWELPSSSGNETQTDSLTGDISFRVEQSRNNGNFKCSDVVTPPTNTIITVGPNDLETSLANAPVSGKWYFYDDTADVLNNSLGGFVAGPATPPAGTGSAVANPLLASNGRTLLTNGGFGGTLLSNISAMSYSYYQPSGAWSANEAPFVRFNVDFSGSPTYQGSLVYVPISNGPVTQNSWQTANMATAGAVWNWSGFAKGPDGILSTSDDNSWPIGAGSFVETVANHTWAEIVAAYPTIKMHPLFPQIGMRVGQPGPVGLTANLDNFSITISAVTKTFNFEN